MRHVCGVRPEDLGPFLLGQLDPDEADRVAAELARCPTCGAEARRLRPVVSALGRLAEPPGDQRPGRIPETALDPVLAAVHQERRGDRARSRRRRLAAAVAAVVVAVLAVGGVLVSTRSGDDARRVTLTGPTSASATVVLGQRDWGTALDLRARGLRPGVAYGAWLEGRDGGRVPAGTFWPSPDGSVTIELGAALSLPDSAAVGVTQLGGKDVLRADL